MSKTITGDNIPSASEWISLFVGEITMQDPAFSDVDMWEFFDGTLFVTYKSGRDEDYRFDMDCVGGGILLV